MTGAFIAGSKGKIAALTGHPDLATLEELVFRENHTSASPFLMHPVLRSLTYLSTPTSLLHVAVNASFAKSLRVLDVSDYDSEDFHAVIVALRAMPALRELEIDIYRAANVSASRNAANVASIGLALSTIPSLERLTCCLVDGEDVEGTFTRSQGSKPWSLTIETGEGRPLADRLRGFLKAGRA